MMKLNSNEWWFGPLFRIAGYGLLGLSLFDIIDIFVPPRFGDPGWEFQIVRNLVERAPVPLLGVVLVFFGEKNFRIFKFLSWSCLVVGVLFMLLLPLGVSSSFRIYQQNNIQLSSQLNQQTTQIKQLRDLLSRATTPEEINSILARLNPQGRPPEINNPQQIKSQLLSEIAQTEKRVKTQVEANRANTRLGLVKKALKSILGALVSGLVFLSIGSKTRKLLKLSRQKV
jgi:hypothetical protein